MTIFSGRGLEEELSKVHSTLSTTGGSGDWKQRIEALQMVRSLLIAGAGQFEELTSQVGTHLTQTLLFFTFSSTVESSGVSVRVMCEGPPVSGEHSEHILFCLLYFLLLMVFSTWQMFRL